jgi:hypothetical protein
MKYMFAYWCLYDLLALVMRNDGVASVGGRMVVSGRERDSELVAL